MKQHPKNILILVGRGKSTLTDWIKKDHIGFSEIDTIYGIKDLIKKADQIKSDAQYFKFIIHLESEDNIKKIPLGIKRRALIFKLDY